LPGGREHAEGAGPYYRLVTAVHAELGVEVAQVVARTGADEADGRTRQLRGARRPEITQA